MTRRRQTFNPSLSSYSSNNPQPSSSQSQPQGQGQSNGAPRGGPGNRGGRTGQPPRNNNLQPNVNPNPNPNAPPGLPVPAPASSPVHMHGNVKSTIASSTPLTSTGNGSGEGQGEVVGQVIVPTRVANAKGRGGKGAGIMGEEEDAYRSLHSGVAGLAVTEGGDNVGENEQAQPEDEPGQPKAEAEQEEQDGPPEIGGDDVCFICAEGIKYWSVGVCGHRTCHICAIRLRVFYKKTDCTFCKTQLPTLLFSSSPTAPFPDTTTKAVAVRDGPDLQHGELDLDGEGYRWKDKKLGVLFETEEIMDDTLLLLRYNCPSPSCAFMASSWDGLEKHTLAVHHSVLCHLCRRQLSRFAHEQVLYPPHLLALHDPSRVPRGHRKPRPRGKVEEEMVASWGPAHPMCEFCHDAFFSSDELFKHMRNKHEECFVCKQRGDRDVYFQNYDKLAMHFSQAHYPCQEPSCLEQKFVVFGSELDWKAHMMQEHKTKSSKDRYQTRVLPVDFVASSALGGDYSYIPPLPNLQAQASSSHQHGPRVEPVNQYSRQTGRNRVNAVMHQQLPQQSEAGANRRGGGGFGAGLTEETGPSNGSGRGTPRNEDPEELNHQHVELFNRVSEMVEFSETKMSSFKHAIRSYKNNEAPARDMIDTFYSIFDRDGENTLMVAKRVAMILRDDKDKVDGIVNAVNAFKMDRQNEYPTLGGSSAAGPSTSIEYSALASGRVLHVKNVTRSSGGNSSAVWDRVEMAASSGPASRPTGSAGTSTKNSRGETVPGAAFPALGGGGSGGKAFRTTNNSTRWANSVGSAPTPGGSTPSAAVNTVRSVNVPGVTASRKVGKPPPAPSAASFPSLPANASGSGGKAVNGFARDEMRKRMIGDKSVPVSAAGWSGGGGSGSNTPVGEGSADEGPAPVAAGGGKKKKKGKETLFTLGQARGI